MAKGTNIELRNKVVYQVYNRNHNQSGTFKEFIKDLDRIKDLGVDIVYLLPIHPIGQLKKKGELGCPYSIKDYNLVNPEYGTLDDFKLLIEEIHKRDMLIMIDVVFNHTSHDAKLLNEHPEYYYKNEKGDFANRVGDWWDITDLDYSNKGLWEELLTSLEYWASLGLDGYRCDVASLVPIEFWLEARDRVEEINPNFIWLSESVHGGFLKYIRDMGFDAHSECEIYQAFDISYDYDIYDDLVNFNKGKSELITYVDKLIQQEYTYPQNYVKLRYLENHDFNRAASYILDEDKLLNWTAFIFFLRGATMIYAGQETLEEKLPSLFDKDLVNWDNYNKYGIVDLIKRMTKIKKDKLITNGVMTIERSNELLHIKYENDKRVLVGIFNVNSLDKEFDVEYQDNIYINLIDGENIKVTNQKIRLVNKPIVFEINK